MNVIRSVILYLVLFILCFISIFRVTAQENNYEFDSGYDCLWFAYDTINTNNDKYTLLKNITKRSSLADLTYISRLLGYYPVDIKWGADTLANANTLAIVRLINKKYILICGGDQDTINVIDSKGNIKPLLKRIFIDQYPGTALLLFRSKDNLPIEFNQRPDLRFKEDDYIFDNPTIEGTKIQHKFSFINVGTKELSIDSVRPTCGCLSTELSSSKIVPNGEGTVTAVFDTTNRYGFIDDKIYIQSNDPITPIEVISVKGIVHSKDLKLSDYSINFGTVSQSNDIAKDITIIYKGNNYDIKDVVSDVPFLMATVYPQSITNTERTERKISFKIIKGSPIGPISTIVTIHTNHPKEPDVIIPVTAIITK